MRRVSTRFLAVALLVLVLAMPVTADSANRSDAGLWAQFVAWINARIGIPNGATAATEGSITFEEWLVLMARIGIPNG